MRYFDTNIWSSSGFDAGVDNRQYAIFQLNPNLIGKIGSKRNYWLKNIATSTNFCNNFLGKATMYDASANWGGVRPRFLIG